MKNWILKFIKKKNKKKKDKEQWKILEKAIKRLKLISKNIKNNKWKIVKKEKKNIIKLFKKK